MTGKVAPPPQAHLTWVVALLAMVAPFTIDTYLPSFPDIEAEFGISRAVLSQSLAVYLAAFAVSTLFWGPLSDRIGRRPVVFSSLVLYVLASIGCALAQSADSFLWMRVLQGLAASGGMIAGRAMIRDAHEAEAAHRAMSQVSMVFALAPAMAPIIGGWLHDLFGWRSVFWFLALLGVVLMGLARSLDETLHDNQRQSFHPLAVARGYGQVLASRIFLARVGALAFSFAGIFLFIAGAPTVIYDFLRLDTQGFANLFVPMVSGLMLGSALSAWLSHRWPMQRTLNLGFAIMAVAALGNLILGNLLLAGLVAVSIASAVTPLALYAFGLALAMPALTILALDCFPKQRGMAAAAQGFVQMMVNAGVASLAVPLLHTRLLDFAFGQTAFLLMALLLWLGWGRAEKQSP